jgi:hypothetical protein
MDNIILDQIPFNPDRQVLLNDLHITKNAAYVDAFDDLLNQAVVIAKPKAMLKAAYIDEKDDESVVVDGIKLTSRVLRVNLDKIHRVFPFIASCGTELDDWSETITDVLYHYWADMIKEKALFAAMDTLNRYLEDTFKLGPVSSMSPGSLPNWPISQQSPLFAILSAEPDPIGVRLTDSFLMVPNKSVSGITFPTEANFASCQLCPREICPNRRMPYDETLFNRKYLPA